MNEKEFNKGIQDQKNISLSQTEKEAMLSHISAYADFHAPKPKVSKRHSFWAFMHMHSSIAYSALGFIFITSSTVYGAEKALPGDILYPFKIYINESVQSALITNVEAQARWESEKFVRRIEEAEILATKGRLDETTLLEVESRIDKHFEKLEELANETPAPEAVITEAPTMMMQAKSAPTAENARVASDASDSSAGDVMMFATFAIEDTSVIEIEKDEFELEIEKHRAILQSIKGDDDKLNERLERLDRKLSEKARKRAEKKANVQIITPAERVDDNSNNEIEIEVEIEDESNDDKGSDDGVNVFESQRQRGKNKDD